MKSKSQRDTGVQDEHGRLEGVEEKLEKSKRGRSGSSKNSVPFHQRLQDFRASRRLTPAALAKEVGVTRTILHRWEKGATRPSPTEAERLEALGFGEIQKTDTSHVSTPRLQGRNAGRTAVEFAKQLRNAGQTTLPTRNSSITILPSPFVLNGPPDQVAFHKQLLSMQVSSTTLPLDLLATRLSMVEAVDDHGTTAQFLLERPRSTAVSWNSNYGPHGWHRYVGRFPPHVVRSLLNYFGANPRTLVCDPFAGSGTTAVECRLLGIPFVGIEICPLSCQMTRTKAAFPIDTQILARLAKDFSEFYAARWKTFLKGRPASSLTHGEILSRASSQIPTFPNVERWFTPAALLGTSIAVEFGMSKHGYGREAVLTALSSRMRSIGNVDVDVVRAEYSKRPRENVDVEKLVSSRLMRMATDLKACLTTHAGLIGQPNSIELHEASVLDVNLRKGSVDFIITSPPYGVEAISYLRTHLLSYRSLVAHLQHDPYDTREKTIGSEYIDTTHKNAGRKAVTVSKSCRSFFSAPLEDDDGRLEQRKLAMMQFCDDMLSVGERMSYWLREGGQVAFILGNKRLGSKVVPLDDIITELFSHCGLDKECSIRHKLKTNNSNSQVPWQDRVIQDESILIFRRGKR